MKNLFRLLAVLIWPLLVSTQTHAGDVTIFATDGSIEVTGELLDFDGNTYTLDTEFGVLIARSEGMECEGAGCPEHRSTIAAISVSGSSLFGHDRLFNLVRRFAEQQGYTSTFTQVDPWRSEILVSGVDGETIAEFAVDLSSTADGLDDLRSGQAKLALTAQTDMSGEGASGGDILRNISTGYEPLVFAVHPNNPVTDISTAEAEMIVAGEISNWSELGGPDLPIALFGSGAFTDIGAYVVARFATDGELPEHYGVDDSGEALTSTIRGRPDSLGVMKFEQLAGLRALRIGSKCGLSVSPSPFAAQAGDYPFVLPLALSFPKGRKSGFLRGFHSFLLRVGGANLTETTQGRAGASAINGETGMPVWPDVLDDALQNASRLSLTLRFDDGTSRLDRRAISDIGLLTRQIESGAYDGRKLKLAGFSDTGGAEADNRRVALRRANVVHETLRTIVSPSALEKVNIEVFGFGEIAPVACDDTPAGQTRNRRVEIWLE